MEITAEDRKLAASFAGRMEGKKSLRALKADFEAAVRALCSQTNGPSPDDAQFMLDTMASALRVAAQPGDVWMRVLATDLTDLSGDLEVEKDLPGVDELPASMLSPSQRRAA